MKSKFFIGSNGRHTIISYNSKNNSTTTKNANTSHRLLQNPESERVKIGFGLGEYIRVLSKIVVELKN